MVETIHPGISAPDARVGVFDFDGTVSLIRSGWNEILASMMLEVLAALDTGESEEELRQVIESLIRRNTGGDTLLQAIAFAEQIALRGGTPLDPRVYRQEYYTRLSDVTGRRIQQLRDGSCPPDHYLVPGTRAFLENLLGRGLRLCIASGTDDAQVKAEADLLDISRYFKGGVFGSLPDPAAFSKRILIDRILARPGMRPYHLIGFGDGTVEMVEFKRAGMLAVGLATDEPECRITSPWKRRNLIDVGADYIIPNYLCRPVLLPMLFANHEPI